MTNELTTLSRNELRLLIQQFAEDLNKRLKNGEEIDAILDDENPFAIFEPYMEAVEFPILVITMINNFQSEKIMNTILDFLEKGIIKFNQD